MAFFLDLFASIVLTIAIVLSIAAIIYLPYWVLMKVFETDLLFRSRHMYYRRYSRTQYRNYYRYTRQRSSVQTKRTTPAYDILGCTPSDSDETVKYQYRRLVKRYHPDLVSSEQSVEDAKQKIQQINNAYDTVKKLRGLKL